MIARTLATKMLHLKDKFPILTLTGPRQAGKTTLLKALFNDYRYVSLENPNNLEFALTDPVGFLKKYDTYTIFDEVQKAPQLFSYLQTKVDEDKIMGQYILSGSQNFQLLEKITQSLAGRTVIFKLLPFSFSELKSGDLFKNTIQEACFYGSYPSVFDRNIDPQDYYAPYLENYVERDMREIINIKDLRLFRKFVKLCAGRVGQLINFSAIANDCGISTPTVQAWFSVLESCFIVFTLPPYFENFTKRVVKSPKLYFYDTGLVCHLLEIEAAKYLPLHPLRGAIFENLIVSEFIKNKHHKHTHKEFYFWQDSAGKEIDIVTKNPTGFDTFEIKSGETITSEFFKNLNYFERTVEPLDVNKTLVYGGDETQIRTDLTVLSWKNIDFTF